MAGVQMLQQTPPALGIVMLDTQFPRPRGDVGHPETFGVSVYLDRIEGVWPAKVVTSAESLRQARLVPKFQSLVRAMQAHGVRAVTTSCGFLVLLQQELQSVATIPVVTSSLLQLPDLLALEQQVGVLTISEASLGTEHLRAAGVPTERLKDVIVQGMPPTGEFASKILGNQTTLDLAQCEREAVDAALKLKARAPQLKTLVLECTNLPPYQAAIEAATGWRVLSLKDDLRLLKVIDATLACANGEQISQNMPSSGAVYEQSI